MATDRVQKEYNLLNEKVQKLHHDLEEQIHTNTQLLAENSQKVVELKQKDAEIEQIKVGQGAEPWGQPGCRTEEGIPLLCVSSFCAARKVSRVHPRCAPGLQLLMGLCWAAVKVLLAACTQTLQAENTRSSSCLRHGLESCSRVAALGTSRNDCDSYLCFVPLQ